MINDIVRDCLNEYEFRGDESDYTPNEYERILLEDFGCSLISYYEDISYEKIARVAHEVNRAYCLSLGDTSQPSWEDAPDWQKTSAINGVKFHMANPDATPEQSHEKWLEEKKVTGWKWGPVKDPEKKEHPCYIQYDRLPQEQKSKDYLFRGVIKAYFNIQKEK